MESESYIACLDVGTTTIRCHVINSKIRSVGSARCDVTKIYPHQGFVEIDPTELWEQSLLVIKKAIANAGLTAKDIKCLGISTQRSTFTTWRRDNGKPFHNFITWKDIRSKDLCKRINKSLIFQTFRWAAYSLYVFTRNKRYLTGSNLKIAPNHVTGRLLWAISNIPELRKEIAENNALFGTVDTWLLYKFTGKHLTDVSNASATAFYDPFVSEWGSWAKVVLKIPPRILPEVVDTDFDFGSTDPRVFGNPIAIRCVMADQSASMFASCCFKEDDLKVTLGTGAFLDVNTAGEIHTSVTGIYPLIAWKVQKEVAYMGEAACNDCGTLMDWLVTAGFVKSATETCDIAASVPDTDGVYFIPAFSGLGPPINNIKAASGFLGIKPTTSQKHLVRSVLEGIVYRMVLAYDMLKKDRNRDYDKVTVDGGVAQNNFVCQLLADLTELKVERLGCVEMTAMGVGFVAGLSLGIWKSKKELDTLQRENMNKVFKPNTEEKYQEKRKREFSNWLEAVERFKSWYDDDDDDE